MNALRKFRSWTAAIGALAMLLLPAVVAAVPLSDTQHFLLGKDPYLHDNSDGGGAGSFSGDGTPLMPGVNAPDVAVVDLSTQVPVNPCSEETMDQWMLLSQGSDFTALAMSDDLPNTGGTPLVPNPVATDWSILLDDGVDIAENAMVTEDGKLKLLFVIWDVREGVTLNDILGAKSVIGGFDKDSFSGDILGGPFLVDATNASPALALPDIAVGDPDVGDPLGSPGLHIVQGLGIKIALDPGEIAEFSALYLLGQDLAAGPAVRPVVDLYWYKIPEPGTAVMLLVGLAGVAYMRRRTH